MMFVCSCSLAKLLFESGFHVNKKLFLVDCIDPQVLIVSLS